MVWVVVVAVDLAMHLAIGQVLFTTLDHILVSPGHGPATFGTGTNPIGGGGGGGGRDNSPGTVVVLAEAVVVDQACIVQCTAGFIAMASRCRWSKRTYYNGGGGW